MGDTIVISGADFSGLNDQAAADIALSGGTLTETVAELRGIASALGASDDNVYLSSELSEASFPATCSEIRNEGAEIVNSSMEAGNTVGAGH